MSGLAMSRAAADAAAERLKIYAQPQRLMILSALLGGERNVGEIETVTGIGQPALSQQLAELRRAEMVQSRRVSRTVLYRLADARTESCVCAIEAMFAGGAAPDMTAVSPRAAPAGKTPAVGAAVFPRILANS